MTGEKIILVLNKNSKCIRRVRKLYCASEAASLAYYPRLLELYILARCH
ncbi:MAG: hypothetical protein M1393_01040 [Candidatus Thermoplasmatota archaeon]|nr:hypothetical protein [Candidatus Thermoplasmatota archaeon]